MNNQFNIASLFEEMRLARCMGELTERRTTRQALAEIFPHRNLAICNLFSIYMNIDMSSVELCEIVFGALNRWTDMESSSPVFYGNTPCRILGSYYGESLLLVSTATGAIHFSPLMKSVEGAVFHNLEFCLAYLAFNSLEWHNRYEYDFLFTQQADPDRIAFFKRTFNL